MNKTLLIFLGVSVFIAGCANTPQKPKIIGTDKSCLNKDERASLEMAKLNNWPIDKLTSTTTLDNGEKLTGYANGVRVPKEFICH